MSQTPLWPLIVTAWLTGCSVRAEVDYEQASRKAAAEATATEDGGGQRQAFRAEDRTTFHLAVEGGPVTKPPHAEEIKRPASDVAPPPTSVANVDQSRQTISVGTMNIHVGDVHHHHVQVRQEVVVTNQTVAVMAETAAPDPTQTTPVAETRVVEDERCERLRREHEARVGGWNRLFDASRRAAPEDQRR